MRMKIAAVGAAAVGLLVLSACSGTGGSKSTSPAAAPASDQKITLKVWSGFTDKELGDLNTALAGFHQLHPNITIDSSGDQDDDKISQAIRGNTAPDVAVSLNGNALGQYCNSGAFQSLDPYLKRDNVDLSQFPSAVQKFTSYQGNHCAMPLLADVYGLYYNKAMFAAAGITAPPKTMSELMADAKKLTQRSADGTIKVAGFVPTIGFYNNRVDNWAAQWGAQWQDSSGKFALAGDPAWTRMLTWQKQLTDFYGASQLTKFTASAGQKYSADNSFQTGKIAMMIDGEFRTGFVDSQAPSLQYATAPFPVADDHPELYGTSEVGGNTVGIPKGAKNPGAAWELIKYLSTDTGALVGLANGLKNMPTTTAAASSPQLTTDANYSTFLKLFVGGKLTSSPVTPNGNAYLKTITDFVVKWQTGGVSDLNSGLAETDKQIEAALKLGN